ncbi:amino acid deaminase/aldolase [Jiangella asiatica]|uniref:Amino acid deaminase/aldolase n=1 Tax=Jiangella asiatica TaxID=2530372 RepID=A0A4R5CJ31_9ACTN|nr:amino acid deaminase/aldolase [Jiangella asiatica]
MRHRLNTATAGFEAPLAAIDIDAWEVNAADLVRRAAGKPIRVASKSLRSRSLLRDVLARDGYDGVLALTLAEALWLAGTELSRDVVVGYPSADRRGLSRLAGDEELAEAVTLMVDDVAQLDLVDAVAPTDGRAEVRVCLELDLSWRPAGGRVRVGAKRSPLHSVDDIVRLAQVVDSRPGFRLVGLLGYESQIAGVQDAPPGHAWRGRLIRSMQRRSWSELTERRIAAVEAVRKVADLEFVNGGGSGSIERTVSDLSITEVTAGSGLLAPRLFDGYTSFSPRPAAFFAVPVVRRPGPGIVTVAGGGYIASGAAGEDRLPVPWLPEGLTLDRSEGAGEAQTPLLGSPADDLAIGDRVWFRHGKAGELSERFDSYYLVRGERLVDTVATYRGDGKTFL